jgi:hypothetical protein
LKKSTKLTALQQQDQQFLLKHELHQVEMIYDRELRRNTIHTFDSLGKLFSFCWDFRFVSNVIWFVLTIYKYNNIKLFSIVFIVRRIKSLKSNSRIANRQTSWCERSAKSFRQTIERKTNQIKFQAKFYNYMILFTFIFEN